MSGEGEGGEERRTGEWSSGGIDPDGAEPEAWDEEPPPAAVRPLGRLASDGWGLALDYVSEPGVEERKLESWLDEVIAEEGAVAETVAFPALGDAAPTPPLAEGAAETVGIDELQRLAMVDDGEGGSESARLEAWLGQQSRAGSSPVAFESPPDTAPCDAPPETAPPRTGGRDALPFEGAPTVAARALEDWVDAWLQADGQGGAPSPPPIEPIRPHPLAQEGMRAAVASEPPLEEEEEEPRPRLLSLEVYAKIKIRLWDDGVPLLRVLEEAGVEEATWREHELRQAMELAEELREGGATLAKQVRQAIADARRERAEEAWAHLVPLETYAALRAQLEPLEDELARREVLARHELTPRQWESQRAGWAKRARLERGTSKRIRRAVARARRQLAT